MTKKQIIAVLMLALFCAPYGVFAETYGDEQLAKTWRSGYDTSLRNSLSDTAVATFPIPVALGVEVSDLTENFGDPRGDGTRSHEGLDMIIDDGTPILSPTDAVVLRTGTGASAGKYVYTVNPGGETFVYMHLSRIANISTGDTLKRGDLIGYVGDTGNALGGAAHLHFEVRKGGATDPFPRLDQTFTLHERIAGVEQALRDRTDDSVYAAFLVREFQSVFVQAKDAGVTVPQAIVDALATSPAQLAIESMQAAPPSEDLTIDSMGAKVVALQEFLIAQNSGSATDRLARAGATGYFGPITEAALAEYQQAVGISPASGYYGPATRSYIQSLEGVMDADEVVMDGAVEHQEASVETVTMGSGGLVEAIPDGPKLIAITFYRDLEYGSKGEDVRELQEFLNTQGFPVATTGPGSAGFETTYFGPATRAALIAFQKANSITPSVGYFGPITRGVMSTYF